MLTEEFFKNVKETSEAQEKHLEFYALAEKYGFCTPWNVDECNKEKYSMV